MRVSITPCVPWALPEPAEPYLPRAAISPSSLRSSVQRLTGRRRPHSGCGAPLGSPRGKAGAALATLPPPALPWLCATSQDRAVHTRGALGSLSTQNTPQDQGTGSSPQAEQARGPSCPSRLRHKSIEGKVGVLLFFCLFDCTKSNKNIPHSAERSARGEGARPRRSSPSCEYRPAFVSSAGRGRVQTDALASCNPRIVHEKK